MHISVIIPVYNAARFLEEAVLSALAQPETAEVLLVEDGSTDDSLLVCHSLAETHPRVNLLTHPGNQNFGASASRNLGIQHATFEYIAFLDADDYYLPARFRTTQRVLESNPDADGVYETVGAVFETALLRETHLQRVGSDHTGLRIAVAPERLYRILATGKQGHIHLNGLVVARRKMDDKITFDPALRQCQDSDWILRLALSARLYGGKIGQPIAVRRVHPGNRVLLKPETIRYQRQYLLKCMTHDFYGSRDTYANTYIVARYVSWLWGGTLRKLGPLSRPAITFVAGLYFLSHPQLLYRIFLQPERNNISPK